jgi:hypothetical protein
MFRRFALSALCCLVLSCTGLAATYSPISQRLEANAWPGFGPDNVLNLASVFGEHQVDSAYTYPSSAFGAAVTSLSHTLLTDTGINLDLGTTTDAWLYRTAGYAQAQVIFDVPAGSTMQVAGTPPSYPTHLWNNWTWSLTGPGGWQWSGNNGDVVAVAAGEYTLTAAANIDRVVNNNYAGSGSVSITVVPEPSSALVLLLGAGLPALRRPRGRS